MGERSKLYILYDTKQRIINFAIKSSLCTKSQETNFKILTRWYLTPTRLHKCFPNTLDRCWRCREEEGSLLHIFWSCPRLENFWGEVRRITQKFTEYNIPEDAAFFLLHHSKILAKICKKITCAPLAKRRQGMYSSVPQCPPTTACWLRKVEHKRENYTKTWSKWKVFIFSDQGQTLLARPWTGTLTVSLYHRHVCLFPLLSPPPPSLGLSCPLLYSILYTNSFVVLKKKVKSNRGKSF